MLGGVSRSRSPDVTGVRIAFIACASLIILGCATQQSTVRTRFSREYQCPERWVRTTTLGGGAWRAAGCGIQVTYVCAEQEGGLDDPVCVLDSGPEETNTSSKSVPEDDEVGELRQPEPVRLERRAGTGFTEFDRFKKRRMVGWKDVTVPITGQERALLMEFVVVTEDGGQAVPRSELEVTVRMTPAPASEVYARCTGLDFLADDQPVNIADTRWNGAIVIAPIPVETFAALAGATRLEGRLCRDEFELDAAQQTQMSRFWEGLQAHLPAEPADVEAGAEPGAAE
jgi:hypothetical protein